MSGQPVVFRGLHAVLVWAKAVGSRLLARRAAAERANEYMAGCEVVKRTKWTMDRNWSG